MTFPTEQQVYHRLRWDTRFDVRRCAVVITLRPTGTRRMPLVELDRNVVPWHRIIEFWLDDELAWSRPQRIDRLDELAARDAPAPALAGIATTPHRHDGDWLAGTLASSSGGLRVVTWNLLCDRYDAERLRSDERWTDAFARLAATDADVLALVEVTPRLWRMLLAQPWTRAYTVVPEPDGVLLEPYGQALLARHPIRDAHVYRLAHRRAVLVARLAVGALQVGVAVVHLSSNRTANAPAVRAAQLADLVAHVRTTPRDAWIVAGDFNAPPEEQALPLADAWPCVRADAGITFDVARNPLAAAASITGTSARYDRIHASGLAPTAAELVGVEPGPIGWPPSDHYGVRVDFAPTAVDLASVAASRRTALVAIPPVERWGPIQRIRCAADRGFPRWPPHVTLLYPFVDPAWLPRAAAVVDEIARAHAPFDLALARVEPINAQTIVVSPEPRGDREIAALHAAVAERFPSLVETRPFRPHLTIARTPSPIDLPERLPIRWTVDHLAILERVGDRFEVVHTSPLARVETAIAQRPIPGEPAVAQRPIPGEPAIARRPIPSGDGGISRADVEAVVDIVAAAAGVRVEPFGSAIYAPASARDVDLLVHADAELAPQLAAELGLSEAGAPNRLRGEIAGTPVDLIVGPTESGRHGPADAAALVEHLADHGRLAAFHEAWPAVRRFVDARALAGNGLGWFGTIGWAMLLAVPLVHDAALCALHGEAIARAWLRWLGTLAPGAHVGFAATTASGTPPLLAITTPAPPAREIARFVAPATAAALFDEFARAARAPERAATPLADAPPPGERLEVTGTAEALGIYRGRFRSLLGVLAARPWAIEVDGASWRHRLTVANAATALPILETWLARLAGIDSVAPVARISPTR